MEYTNEIAVLDSSVPIKAIPDVKLNTIIVLEFVPWISKLLSLTGQTSKERLKVALPAIKEHCWSMGFSEIKKMFELYVDNKLSIEPRTNFLDRIQFGKIATAYKQQLPQRKAVIEKQDLTDEDKKLIVYTGIMNCFAEYKDTGAISPGYSYAYDHFYELGKFPKHDHSFRDNIQQRALKAISLDKTHSKKLLSDSVNRIKQNTSALKTRCKEIILTDWFDELIEKGIDIKDEL